MVWLAVNIIAATCTTAAIFIEASVIAAYVIAARVRTEWAAAPWTVTPHIVIEIRQQAVIDHEVTNVDDVSSGS